MDKPSYTDESVWFQNLDPTRALERRWSFCGCQGCKCDLFGAVRAGRCSFQGCLWFPLIYFSLSFEIECVKLTSNLKHVSNRVLVDCKEHSKRF
jgi:hypothetical protein